ncbi:MAG: hypothetical protein LQ341_006139 [Variospora aurantia]|nr:MAG: hypothetical protein LQ341_006139 [Variospora aurantia]
MSAPKDIAENLWSHYASNLNHGFIDKIIVDPMVANAIGNIGIAHIAKRFEAMIDHPVKTCGGGQYAISITPVYSTDGRRVDIDGAAKAKLKKDKVARPPNAFILYRQHHHAKVVAEYPHLHNNQISIILGQQWQHEKDDVKAQFKAMAEEIKKKHLSAHPNYQYQPRKPTEKKRRMTRRKAEKLATAATTITDPQAISEVVPTFKETSMGNPVFTLGDDMIDEDALAAMVDKHNGDVASSGAPYREVPPVLWHEIPAEIMDDINFYGNLLDFENLYREEYGTEQLLAAEELTVAASAARSPQVQQNAFDQFIAQQQTKELGRMSTLWPSPEPEAKAEAEAEPLA